MNCLPRNCKFILTLICLFYFAVACTPRGGIDKNTVNDDDVALTGMPTAVSSLTPTAATTPTLRSTPTTPATRMTPTVTTSVVTVPPTEELSPTATKAVRGLGRVYQLYKGGAYAWSDLTLVDGELEVRDGDNAHALFGDESPHSPANPVEFAFSHYSDQVGYWTKTYPSELWVSDVAYEQPRRVFTDSEGLYVGASYLPVGEMKLAWSPDDRYLITYTSEPMTPYLIYDSQTGKIEDWYWLCQDVIRSPRTDQFAILCRLDEDRGFTPENAYAILEWGGDIWYTSQPPENLLSRALPDGTLPWRLSADGQQLAYFDPDDPEEHLLIADADGSVRRFLPGGSVLQRDERITNFETQYYKGFSEREFGLFRWSQNGELILVYALGNPERPCRQIADSQTGKLYEEPCWQVLDAETGAVLWTDLDSAETLFQDEFELTSMRLNYAVFSPNGEWIAIRAQYFSYELLAVVDLKTHVAYALFPIQYAEIYWGKMQPDN